MMCRSRYGAASVAEWRSPRVEALEELRRALDPASTEQVQQRAHTTATANTG
jgi:hypothetical protein